MTKSGQRTTQEEREFAEAAARHLGDIAATDDAVSFTVYGLAAPAGSKTVGHTKQGRAFVRDSSGHRGSDWRRNVAQQAGLTMRTRPLLDGPLELHVVFHVPRPKAHQSARGGVKPSAPERPTSRPDITKLLRAVEDAITGICWRDDAQIVIQHAEKRYGEPARADITIIPAPGAR